MKVYFPRFQQKFTICEHLFLIFQEFFSLRIILEFSIKYKFGTKKDHSNCSRVVFMKTLYFFVLKTDHIWSSRTISKKQKLEENFSDNFGQNICRLFQVLTKLSSPQVKRNFVIIIRKWIYELPNNSKLQENPWNVCSPWADTPPGSPKGQKTIWIFSNPSVSTPRPEWTKRGTR